MSAAVAAQRLLGVRAVTTAPLGGATRVGLADGREVVVKFGDGTRAEAAGLRWLAVDGGPGIAQVLADDDRVLITAWVPAAPGGPAGADADRFGRALAALHAAGAAAFGAPPPGGPAQARIGTAPMRDVGAPDWAAWYATDRIAPYVAAARDAGTIGPADAAVFDRVCERLPDLAGPVEPPARLHGDLWSGNVLWAREGALLIDPAAHGGHRETDLAMLALFGLPRLDRVLAAYGEVAPLAAGWPDRVALHQLFPLLVHVVLFGGSYAGQARAAAMAALRAG